MARINVPTNIIDSAMLKAAMDIQQQKADSISSKYKNYLSSIKDLTSTLPAIGRAYDEYSGEKTREEQVSDFLNKYQDDPVAKAAAYNFISGKDPNAISTYEQTLATKAATKAKEEELKTQREKAIADTIESSQLQYDQNMMMYNKTGDDRYLNEANKAALQIKQSGGKLKEAITPSQWDFQKAAQESRIAADEQASLESEKKNLEMSVDEYNQRVESARKIPNANVRREELAKLYDEGLNLRVVAKNAGVTKLPSIIREDEFTVTKKPVADENTRTKDTSKYVLPNGYHWTQTTSGMYKAVRDE